MFVFLYQKLKLKLTRNLWLRRQRPGWEGGGCQSEAKRSSQEYCIFPHLQLTTDLMVSVPTVVSFSKCHISGIILYVALCILHLSLSMTVECISSSFPFIAENIIVQMDHIMFIHLPVDGYLCYFQFGAIMNNADNNKANNPIFEMGNKFKLRLRR